MTRIEIDETERIGGFLKYNGEVYIKRSEAMTIIVVLLVICVSLGTTIVVRIL